MKHLDEMRIMELALDPAVTPQNGEVEHLESCALCASMLDEERRLTEALDGFEQAQVPSEFDGNLECRFKKANRARSTRQILMGLAALVVITVPVVALMVARTGSILRYVAALVGELAMALGALVTVAGTLPLAATIAVAAFCVLGIAICALLFWVGKSKSVAKYFAEQPVWPDGNSEW